MFGTTTLAPGQVFAVGARVKIRDPQRTCGGGHEFGKVVDYSPMHHAPYKLELERPAHLPPPVKRFNRKGEPVPLPNPTTQRFRADDLRPAD
jgi:hypothetical protein